jgi:hypothetical protein
MLPTFPRGKLELDLVADSLSKILEPMLEQLGNPHTLNIVPTLRTLNNTLQSLWSETGRTAMVGADTCTGIPHNTFGIRSPSTGYIFRCY